jgi:prepilin-type N-terminal cleavage/methylation domain-containing protein
MASKAFSLVEIIIAVFVIGVGLAAAALFIASSFRISLSVKNLLIASHLAQEGIELARNIRDGNWLDPSAQGWSEGLQVSNCMPGNNSQCPFYGNLDFLMDSVANTELPGHIGVDFNLLASCELQASENDRLYLDTDSRYLHYRERFTGLTQTKFYRYLGFNYEVDSTGNYYLHIYSCVKWKEGDKWRKILIQEKLYNWK